MAVSLTDLVQRVRDLLGDRPLNDTSTTTTTATTIVVADTTLHSVGEVFEWQTGTVGFEQCYVKSITNATDMVVVRGYNGTTAETHTSGDTIVTLTQASITGRNIQQSLTQVMNASWPQVWIPGTVNLTYSATTKWYDLNALTKGIVSVTQKKNVTIADYGRFRDFYTGDGRSYIVQRDLPTSIVASGTGIHFPQGVYDTSGTNVIVVRDVRLLTGTSDIEDTGTLPVAEALVWGAASRLLKAKEVSRVMYGEPLTTGGTVGSGARFGLGREFEQEWQRRLETIKVQLQAAYDPDDVWIA